MYGQCFPLDTWTKTLQGVTGEGSKLGWNLMSSYFHPPKNCPFSGLKLLRAQEHGRDLFHAVSPKVLIPSSFHLAWMTIRPFIYEFRSISVLGNCRQTQYSIPLALHLNSGLFDFLQRNILAEGIRSRLVIWNVIIVQERFCRLEP